jgi:hypothetical protein
MEKPNYTFEGSGAPEAKLKPRTEDLSQSLAKFGAKVSSAAMIYIQSLQKSPEPECSILMGSQSTKIKIDSPDSPFTLRLNGIRRGFDIVDNAGIVISTGMLLTSPSN